MTKDKYQVSETSFNYQSNLSQCQMHDLKYGNFAHGTTEHYENVKCECPRDLN